MNSRILLRVNVPISNVCYTLRDICSGVSSLSPSRVSTLYTATVSRGVRLVTGVVEIVALTGL